LTKEHRDRPTIKGFWLRAGKDACNILAQCPFADNYGNHAHKHAGEIAFDKLALVLKDQGKPLTHLKTNTFESGRKPAYFFKTFFVGYTGPFCGQHHLVWVVLGMELNGS